MKAGLKGKVKGPCVTSNLHTCFNTFLFKPRINRSTLVGLPSTPNVSLFPDEYIYFS